MSAFLAALAVSDGIKLINDLLTYLIGQVPVVVS